MSATPQSSLIDLLARHLGTLFPEAAPPERERLLAAILCGDVLVAGERCREPKRRFPDASAIVIAARSQLLQAERADAAGGPVAGARPAVPCRPFVSRGGEKLDSVLAAWAVPVAGRVWLDAGSSTGGFTHCLLLRGASLVHAVDVGYNLLDWRLRVLPQVCLHERTNIMGLESLEPQPAAAVADLSFRSMAGAAAKILALTLDNELYGLIKPQFERKYGAEMAEPPMAEPGEGPEAFNGVVAETEVTAILRDVVVRLAAEGIGVDRIAPAGLKGRTGNQEYLALLRLKPGLDAGYLAEQGARLVDRLF